MAPGSTLTYRVEIEFGPGSGTYVDLSNRVTGVTITRPPGTRFGEATPTTVSISLLNHPATAGDVATWATAGGVGYCPLSTDSPPSAFYPNVTRDRLVKVTAVWAGGASTAVRFWGWADNWIPDAGSLPPNTATVTLTASCILGRYARRTLLSQYGERNIQDPDYDYWPLNEAPDSTTLKGYAQPGQAVNDATVVLPKSAPGSATLQAPEGGHATDGQIEFTRGDNLNYPSPVVLVPLRRDGSVFSTFEAWFKLTSDETQTNDDAITAYQADGTVWWRWTVTVALGLVTWVMYDNTNTAKVSYSTNSPRDEGWHFWFLRFGSNVSDVFYSNRGNLYAAAAGSGTSWTYDPRAFQYLVVGGRMSPTQLGKQVNTFQGVVSSFRVAYNGDAASGQGFNDPGTSIQVQTHKDILIKAGLGVDAYTGGGLSTGTDIRPILTTTQYPNLLDRWNELTRSTLSELRTRTDGRREWAALGATRPVTVALTLDAEQGLSAPDGGWVLVKDESPTRVNVTAPPGSITYTRATVEAASGIRLDGGTIDTASGDTTGMRAVAAWATYQTAGRVTSFGLDATTTSTDQLTAVMALQPRDRVRVTNLAVALTGVSYLDMFVYGWVETFDPDSGACGFQFDSWAADDPPEGVYDDAEYGRWAFGDGTAAGTSGTAIGTLAAGTLVITSSKPLTVNAASYPLDLDWAGERVTIPAAPASSTSPQTVTIGTRGVAPTVARIHAAGDPVDIWHADRFGA